jgi:hypothetical protein
MDTFKLSLSKRSIAAEERMLYMMAKIQVAPGKMEEFTKVFNEEFAPSCARLGRKLVGQWKTYIGDMDEVTDLWQYHDLTDMQRFNEARMKDDRYLKALTKLGPLVAHETMKLMYPTALSPMK